MHSKAHKAIIIIPLLSILATGFILYNSYNNNTKFKTKIRKTLSTLITNDPYEQQLISISNIHNCKPLKEMNPQNDFVDLIVSLYFCHQGSDQEVQRNLFWASKVYRDFDVERVSDKSAHQAAYIIKHNILAPIHDDMTKEDFKKHAEFIEKGEKTEFCKTIHLMSRPEYVPLYMINHGMGEIIDRMQGIKTNDKAKVTNLDVKWKKSIESACKS
jgi:hypothetical protein